MRAATPITQRYGFGTWAVIMGNSGYYADELARHRFNLVLVGNNDKMLKKEAKALEQQYQISTSVIKSKLESHDDKYFKKI
jgi:short-subunit dehydrogenase